MRLRRIASLFGTGCLLAGSLAAPSSAATSPVQLGAAAPFAVMAGTTVTSAGVSTLTGDLGVSPGTALTGFPPGLVSGTVHAGDPAAAAAHADVAAAIDDAAGRSPAAPVAGDLGAQTLTPGVYAAGAALTLAGTLTLDAGGDPAGVFLLKAGSTLGTAAGSHVVLAGGAQACNVFWLVGSSATLGASSDLAGTVVASTSVSLGDGITVDGRILARDGAVTMVNDNVAVTDCVAGALTNTAPALAPFDLALTGTNQTVHTAVGAWSVTDARGTGAGYSITVSATDPQVNGSSAAAGTGGSLTLTPPTAHDPSGNSRSVGPVASPAQILSTVAATIENAPAGTGQGEWDFPANSGSTESLAIVIAGDASAGSYRTTLTFTTAPPVL